MPDLIDVGDYNPYNVNLVPVEGNPFALQGDVGAAIQQQNAAEAQRRATAGGLLQHFTTPGQVSQGVQPETPGVMTEADAYRLNQLEDQARNWAPQQAMNMIGTGVPMSQAGALGMAGGGIKAYHGSPHDFDAFDLSKIGTGEGAQAYGHGLYFAEHPETAEVYKQQLSRRNIDASYGGAKLTTGAEWQAMIDNLERRGAWREGKLLDQYGKQGGPLEAYIRQQSDWYRDQPEMMSALERFKQKMESNWTPGRMYEVNINADPEHFLDWDKPLSEQHPKVQEALEPFRRATVEDWSTNPTLGEPTQVGQVIANHSMNNKGEELTNALREAGIPGIKYLDQGSRGSGQGTSNYVVFNDKLIDIIKKYGLAGLVAGGASHFTTTPVSHNPFAAQQ